MANTGEEAKKEDKEKEQEEALEAKKKELQSDKKADSTMTTAAQKMFSTLTLSREIGKLQNDIQANTEDEEDIWNDMFEIQMAMLGANGKSTDQLNRVIPAMQRNRILIAEIIQNGKNKLGKLVDRRRAAVKESIRYGEKEEGNSFVEKVYNEKMSDALAQRRKLLRKQRDARRWRAKKNDADKKKHAQTQVEWPLEKKRKHRFEPK
jgi:hypothetical protein